MTTDDVLAGLDLSRRTIVIAGCNSAVGFETFHALAAYMMCMSSVICPPLGPR